MLLPELSPGSQDNAQRRVRVEELAVQGWQRDEIALELGVSSRKVSADLRWVRAKWRARAERGLHDVLAEQLAYLDYLQRAAWLGWQRSWESVSRTTKSRKSLASGQQDQVATTEADHLGESRFLVVVLHCIDRRCQLLKLAGPIPPRNDNAPSLRDLARLAGDADLTAIAAGYEQANRILRGETGPEEMSDESVAD